MMLFRSFKSVPQFSTSRLTSPPFLSETSEGLDTLMALRYYSRMRLLHNFLPLLLRSPSPRVVSILAAGHEGKLYPSDLSLRSHYGLSTTFSTAPFSQTLFSQRHV